MNEARKHNRFIATLVALVAFLLGIVLSEMAIGMGNACWEFAHRIETEYPGQRLEPFETLLHWFCVAIGLLTGIFVFRVCRRSVSPVTIFHVSYAVGLAFLCFSLWLILISFPLLDTSLVMDWSTEVLTPLFSAPLTCLVFTSAGVLLLSYASAYDNSRNA